MHRDWWKLMTRDIGQCSSALHDACLYGHTALVKMLLSKGADPHAKTTKGWTPLHSASWTGHTECVTVLLEHGARPDDVTDFGWNALHCAAARGKTSLVSFFLEYEMP